MTNYSLNSKSTSKAAVVHATQDGNLLCSNQVADISKGAFSNMEVTCKRCLAKINAASKPVAEKKSKAKGEAKAKKVSQKALVAKLATDKAELAQELVNTPREIRKQPEFVAKRVRLIELRKQLADLGYEATTFQANAKILAGIGVLVTKKTRKKKAK